MDIGSMCTGWPKKTTVSHFEARLCCRAINKATWMTSNLDNKQLGWQAPKHHQHLFLILSFQTKVLSTQSTLGFSLLTKKMYLCVGNKVEYQTNCMSRRPRYKILLQKLKFDHHLPYMRPFQNISIIHPGLKTPSSFWGHPVHTRNAQNLML